MSKDRYPDKRFPSGPAVGAAERDTDRIDRVEIDKVRYVCLTCVELGGRLPSSCPSKGIDRHARFHLTSHFDRAEPDISGR